MPNLRNNPYFLIEEECVGKNQEQKNRQIREMTPCRAVPGCSEITDIISKQCDKFLLFSLEEANKYRFYSKNSNYIDDALIIVNNEITHMTIMEKEIQKILANYKRSLTLTKEMLQTAITDKKKDKLRNMRATINETDVMDMINKMPEDIVRYIASYFTPSLRVMIMKEKYKYPSAREFLTNVPPPKLLQLRESIQKYARKTSWGYYYTGGKNISSVYNSMNKLIEIQGAINNSYNSEYYSLQKIKYLDTDDKNKIVNDILFAIFHFENVVNYEIYKNMPQNNDPNSAIYSTARQMDTLLRIYQLISYTLKRFSGTSV
jgi:hypothetical protein